MAQSKWQLVPNSGTVVSGTSFSSSHVVSLNVSREETGSTLSLPLHVAVTKSTSRWGNVVDTKVQISKDRSESKDVNKRTGVNSLTEVRGLRDAALAVVEALEKTFTATAKQTEAVESGAHDKHLKLVELNRHTSVRFDIKGLPYSDQRLEGEMTVHIEKGITPGDTLTLRLNKGDTHLRIADTNGMRDSSHVSTRFYVDIFTHLLPAFNKAVSAHLPKLRQKELARLEGTLRWAEESVVSAQHRLDEARESVTKANDELKTFKSLLITS